jgi:hypothetical protein
MLLTYIKELIQNNVPTVSISNVTYSYEPKHFLALSTIPQLLRLANGIELLILPGPYQVGFRMLYRIHSYSVS